MHVEKKEERKQTLFTVIKWLRKQLQLNFVACYIIVRTFDFKIWKSYDQWPEYVFTSKMYLKKRNSFCGKTWNGMINWWYRRNIFKLLLFLFVICFKNVQHFIISIISFTIIWYVQLCKSLFVTALCFVFCACTRSIINNTWLNYSFVTTLSFKSVIFIFHLSESSIESFDWVYTALL